MTSATDTPIDWFVWQEVFADAFLAVVDDKPLRPYLTKYNQAFEAGQRSGKAYLQTVREWEAKK